MGVRGRLLGGLLACAALVACAQSHDCTAIGANSGLFVTGGTTGGLLTVCAGEECGSVQTGVRARFLDLPALVVGKQSLRATYKRGQEVVTSEVEVEAVKRQPNGPDCEPTVAVANISVRPDGHVLHVTK